MYAPLSIGYQMIEVFTFIQIEIYERFDNYIL